MHQTKSVLTQSHASQVNGHDNIINFKSVLNFN